MNISHLTPLQLRQAADLKEKIESLERQFASVTGGITPPPVEAPALAQPAKPGKRTMSPAHKAKIRAAQALRWAKYNAAKAKTSDKGAKLGEGGPKKGGMSAAGRARIAEAQKLRWSKVKAAKISEAPAKSEAKPAKKRRMSAAARAAISAAAKARWAKIRAAKKA